MSDGVIQSRRYRQMRADFRAQCEALNLPCRCCGLPIDYAAPPNDPDAFELDHVISRKARPDLAYDPSNFAPSRHACNRAKGAGPTPSTLGTTSEDF